MFFKLEYNCFTMLCLALLYNEVNQICAFIYTLPLESPAHPHIPSLQVITEHQAEQPALYSSFPLAIYFKHSGVYMSVLISQFVLPSAYPSASTCSFSTSSSLFLPWKKTILSREKRQYLWKILGFIFTHYKVTETRIEMIFH